MFPNIKIVEAIRKEYPAGTRVRLVKMDDIQAPPLGTEGTVVGVDDTGSLLMHWDNGSHLNIVYTECLNLAKSIDAIMLCYNPDIDALKAENLSDMAVRLLDGVSRRDVVKDLEDFRDKWRHYNEQAAAESQVILDKISELLEKDGDSK